MKKLLVATIAVVLLGAALPAYAGELTAKVTTPTCDKPRFGYELRNTKHTYQKFTFVLYNDTEDGHRFIREKVPANGGFRGSVTPDWERRSFYVVEVFRSWEWRPWNHDWRLSHWLAGSSADLGDCP